jgi:hypothetical protein
MPDLGPPSVDSDFYFVPADDPETAVLRVIASSDKARRPSAPASRILVGFPSL